MSNLLEQLRHAGERRASDREHALRSYKEILARANCPANTDSLELSKLAAELGLSPDTVEADVVAAIRQHEQRAAERAAVEQQRRAKASAVADSTGRRGAIRCAFAGDLGVDRAVKLAELCVTLLDGGLQAKLKYLRGTGWIATAAGSVRRLADGRQTDISDAFNQAVAAVFGELAGQVRAELTHREKEAIDGPPPPQAEPPVVQPPPAGLVAPREPSEQAVYYSGAQTLPSGV